MGSLADQRDAGFGKLPGLLDRKGEQMASRFDTDAAENGMRLFFCGLGQLVIGKRHQPFGLLRCCNPDHAGAVAGQRDKYAWTLRGVKLGRDVSVRPRMADIESQRRLMALA